MSAKHSAIAPTDKASIVEGQSCPECGGSMKTLDGKIMWCAESKGCCPAKNARFTIGYKGD
jgi:hypothetical protein